MALKLMPLSPKEGSSRELYEGIKELKPMRVRYSFSVALLSFVASASLLSLFAPLLSSAQESPEGPGSAQESPAPAGADGRASMAVPAEKTSVAVIDREAALRQAEDDLLRKLSGTMPQAGAANAAADSAAVMAAPDVPTTRGEDEGFVISTQVTDAASFPPTTSVSAPGAPTGSAAAAGVAALSQCPPCAVAAARQAPPRPVRAKPAARAPSRPREAVQVSSRSVRDDFLVHDRSGDCSGDIDDPYVPTSNKARITASNAHLRLAAGPSESTLFIIPRNSVVDIDIRNGQWYRVITSTGIRGWVAAKDVVFDYGVPSTSTVSVAPYNGSYEPTGIKF